jgi:methionine biosynthesis protein MetW
METKSRPYHDYRYPDPEKKISRTRRPEYDIIKEWIEPNSKVLDLGCGDGSLGEILIKEKNCEVYGIEIDKNGVKQAIRKGVHAVQGDMDKGLDYPDDSFDYVVINVTLQMVYRPDLVATEALRVGKRAIISFPNFAHIYARFEMLLLGRMPRSPLFGYKWYSTRHIHMFSFKDFIEFMKELNAKVLKKEFLWLDSKTKNIFARLFPNLFSGTVILMVQKRK